MQLAVRRLALKFQLQPRPCKVVLCLMPVMLFFIGRFFHQERRDYRPEGPRFGFFWQPPLTFSERCAQITPIFEENRRDYDIGSMKNNAKGLAILNLADSLRSVPGDIAEAGVAGGSASLALLFYLACVGDMQNRSFLLFDTWQGLPTSDNVQDEGWHSGAFNVKMKGLLDNMEKFGKVYKEKVEGKQFDEYGMMRRSLTWDELIDKHVHKFVGTFNETMPTALAGKTLAMLMCDGDMYMSTMHCLTYGEPRLSPGGWIYEDDYYHFRSDYLAVNDYRREAGIRDEESPILLVYDYEWWKFMPWYPDRLFEKFRLVPEKDGINCKPPRANVLHDPGTCEGRKTYAAVWRKA